MLSFTKTRPLGVQSFHANGQTAMMKLIVSFRSLANARNNDHSTVQQTVLPYN